jgi:hypothetical protein
MAEEGKDTRDSFRTSINAFFPLCAPTGVKAPTLLSDENLVCQKENLDHEWAVFAGFPTT